MNEKERLDAELER